MGEVILELVAAPPGTKFAANPDGPAAVGHLLPRRGARLWGISFRVEELDHTATALGDLLGEPRPAVQPGRRIATLRREAGPRPGDRVHDARPWGNSRLMKYRKLGRTGLEVSEIGYGAWGIGGAQWGGADDDESIQALHRAIDLGLNFIDTALAYGDGRSERLVGEVVRERSETVYVATKVPPANGIWPAARGVPLEEVFPAGYIRECAERSLGNLGTDSVDLLQLHVWNDEWSERDALLGELDELRSEGKIRFFGISINDHQPANGLSLVESGAVDAVQVIYNVFDQSPEDELIPACREHEVGVLARVPLDEGGLTGKIGPDTEFSGDDFRAHYFRGDRAREVHERTTAIASDLGIAQDELAETALRFILSEPAVSTVIPGMRSLRNVERNVAVSDGRTLPADWREKLRAHRWVRNFYD